MEWQTRYIRERLAEEPKREEGKTFPVHTHIPQEVQTLNTCPQMLTCHFPPLNHLSISQGCDTLT